MIPAIDVPKKLSNTGSSGNDTDHTNHIHNLNVSHSHANNNSNNEKKELHEFNHSEPSLCLEKHHERYSTFKDSSAFLSELIKLPSLVEKSVIIHRDENGFGLRVKGQAPVFVEHVHDNGAAWRAGVRKFDQISKVNGVPVNSMDHKDVVLMFKSCTRFVGLTLLSSISVLIEPIEHHQYHYRQQQNSNQPQIKSTSSSSPSSNYNITAASSLIKSMPFDLASSQPSQMGFMLNKQYCNSHSCSFMFRSLKSSDDFSSDISQKGQVSTSKTFLSTPSTYSQQKTQHQEQQQQQQQQAKRSESVTIKSSYLAGNQVVKNGMRGERRTSESEIGGNLAITVGDNNDSTKQKQTTTRNSCIECKQAKISQLSRQTSSGQLTAHSELYRQSLFNSLRYSQASRQKQQQQQHQINLRVTNSTNSSNRNINIIDTSHSAKASISQNDTFHKLKQSPSMNSLPASESMNNNNNNNNNNSSSNNSFVSSQNFSPLFINNNNINNNNINNYNHDNKQPMQQVNKRLEIIKEFIDTERTHTDRMRYLDELFYRPLKNGAFMTNEQLRMVFSCHRTLFKIHKQIYRILLSANYNLYSEPMIGSALLEIFESDLKRRLEKAACNFCVAQSTNVELLNKLTRRDTKVGEFIAQVTSQQMVGRLGIKDLLASCFQRLTKYPLLLENLLKATPQPESIELVVPVASKRHLSLASSNQSDLNKKLSEEETKNKEKNDNNDINNNNDEKEKQQQQEEEEGEEEAGESEEPAEVKNSRRMLAISLAEEREFIERALYQSRQILIKVNDSVKVAMSHNKLKEIWKRTDKYPGVPLIDITKQQVVHEGLLTLRLSKRSFDVYVLLLNDYIIILTREGQDKYRLKFFTPDGKSSSSSSNNSQTVYSPVFVIDEHLTTRDAATDENGFYLLCKRKDDSRIYEFASRSPAERSKWRDRIQWTIERQMLKINRRPSSESTFTKSSSEISSKLEPDEPSLLTGNDHLKVPTIPSQPIIGQEADIKSNNDKFSDKSSNKKTDTDNKNSSQQQNKADPTKVEGTISYVEDDGIVMPSKLGSSQVLVDQAIQVNIFDTQRKPVVVPSN